MKIIELISETKVDSLSYVLQNSDAKENIIHVNPNGVVDIRGSIMIKAGPKLVKSGVLRVTFGEVNGHFEANGMLKSLKGVPRKVGRFISVANSPELTSLEGITEEAPEIDFLRCEKITSLKDIHKMVKSCKKMFIADTVKSNILGLCLIKDLTFVSANHNGAESLTKALAIINKHLGQGRSGMIKAQRELIENDLDEYAEL